MGSVSHVPDRAAVGDLGDDHQDVQPPQVPEAEPRNGACNGGQSSQARRRFRSNVSYIGSKLQLRVQDDPQNSTRLRGRDLVGFQGQYGGGVVVVGLVCEVDELIFGVSENRSVPACPGLCLCVQGLQHLTICLCGGA